MAAPSDQSSDSLYPYGFAQIPEVGDPNPEVLYTAVGRALSAWENAEAQLCWTYAGLIRESRYSLAAVKRYSAQPTFAGRSNALQQALDDFISFDQELCGNISGFIAESKLLVITRNEIAHGIVRILRDALPEKICEDGMIIKKTEAEYCLVPAFYNHRYSDNALRPKYIFTSADINARRDSFWNFGIEVWKFNLRTWKDGAGS